MQTASTAWPRLRTWLALGATCAVVAGVVIARTQHRAAPAIGVIDIATTEAPVTEPLPIESTRVAAPTAAIGIVVVATRTTIKRGEPLPLAFYAVNRTAAPLNVVRSLDASDAGWRYPNIDIEIRDANGHLILGPTVGRCGLMNPLAADDFVELASRGRVDLLGEGTFGHYKLRDTSYLLPGTYSVTLRYDLRFDDKLRPIDDNLGPDILAKLAAVPKGVYFSPSIAIDVK